jgi:hydroxylamine dehydrogenase
MRDTKPQSGLRTARLLILGLVVVIVVMGIILIIMAIVGPTGTPEAGLVDALANSSDECVVCHRRSTPGIVEQFGHSTMAAAEVLCKDCHEVKPDYPGAVEHEGTYVLGSPTPAMCQGCHEAEVAQFNQSRHSLPAYVAYAGAEGLSADLLKIYQSIPEAAPDPNKMRNALYALEGPEVTQFACEVCHNIGLPAVDGSIGQCQKCHLRHEFSLEQVRKPETCNFCHIGPDHPQWEIYHESPHGIAFETGGGSWHWQADPGTLTVNDFPAPTCAICHISGFGTQGTSHDVGDRLTWYLFSPISERRPSWEDNKVRMQAVCLECHNKEFVNDFYTAADTATLAVNQWVSESDQMMAPLNDQGLLTSQPFDEPIDFTYFELWHHWGRTAKFGVWMRGPDYTQWHGAYEILSDLAELRQMIDQKLLDAGLEP